jgi:HAD superfamily 5'-nucleotidase-like hydrolase
MFSKSKSVLLCLSKHLSNQNSQQSICKFSQKHNHILSKYDLLKSYEKYKQLCLKSDDINAFQSINNYRVDPKGVFCNNEIDLSEIQVYGFDYDYTLAYYNQSLYQLIFNLARDSLVHTHKYPSEIHDLEYLPHFPIRGLHLDIKKGWLMKVDSYHNIQLGTVHYGMNAVDNEVVLKYYGGRRLNEQELGHSQTSSNFHQYVDLFCLPEISLLSAVFQYFLDKNLNFTPEYVFQDVKEAVDSIHRNQLLHKHIAQSIESYLIPTSESSLYVKEFLTRLKRSGKNIFLITNSPYWFVNFGMQSLCGSDWTDLFDLIICSARKPHFFTSRTKPFRRFNIKTNSKAWESVREFKKGEIYYEGNLYEMIEHTGWPSQRVLYFGDHIYGDLAQPFLKFGWRTGAIINEIEDEIIKLNNLDYQRSITWLCALENLLEILMNVEEDYAGESLEEIKQKWFAEREEIREKAKKMINPYFGSVFRANNNPSFFSRRLSRFADIYTSNVTNLLEYPVGYHLIAKRLDLAHEVTHKIKVDV